MIDIKKPVVLGVVASLALGIFAAVPAAHADPVSGGYAAAGSDTLDSSMNGLTNGTSATGSSVRITAADGSSVGSFDAFGSATVQTKSGGPYFQRPSGSGQGVLALRASITGTNYGTPAVNVAGQVDIARSSSGPGTNANAAGKLIYIPYARDAVAYAYIPDPAHPADLANLTTVQLKALYTSGSTTIGSTVVTPLIPQSSSGTRKFFLSAIGVDTSGNGVCGIAVCTSSTLPENDATQLTAVGQVIPFSAGNWVAQSNNVAQNTIALATKPVALGAPDSVPAYTGTGTSLVPSQTFYNSIYGRDTYLIVEYARITVGDPKYDLTLAALVDSTQATSLTNFSASLPSQPGSVKQKYGFLAPSTTTPQRAYLTL